MRLILFTLIISIIMPAAVFGQNAVQDSIGTTFDSATHNKEPIEQDWVEIDRKIIQNVINKIPSQGHSLTSLLQIIPHFIDGKCNCVTYTTDLGYELKSTRYRVWGGYGSFFIDAIYSGDDILKVRLKVGYKEGYIEKHFFEDLDLPFDCKNNVCYERIYSENVEKYQKGLQSLFLESTDSLSRRRIAINYFTDVLSGSVFEDPYHMKNDLELGVAFDHLRYFLVNNDVVALQQILFSPSPTGRLFAACALMYMSDKFGYKPRNEVDDRIKNVISNAEVVKCGTLNCHLGKFNYDNYDVVQDFELLLQEH